MSLLRIEVGAIAVHRDRLVMICSVGAPVRIRDLVTGEIREASVADLSARKTPELTRKSACRCHLEMAEISVRDGSSRHPSFYQLTY